MYDLMQSHFGKLDIKTFKKELIKSTTITIQDTKLVERAHTEKGLPIDEK